MMDPWVIAQLRPGLEAAVSQTAGTFVCNHVFYGLQHRLAGRGVRSGFVHVPLLPAQALRYPGQPTMTLDDQVRGVRTVLAVALRHQGADLAMADGRVA